MSQREAGTWQVGKTQAPSRARTRSGRGPVPGAAAVEYDPAGRVGDQASPGPAGGQGPGSYGRHRHAARPHGHLGDLGDLGDLGGLRRGGGGTAAWAGSTGIMTARITGALTVPRITATGATTGRTLCWWGQTRRAGRARQAGDGDGDIDIDVDARWQGQVPGCRRRPPRASGPHQAAEGAQESFQGHPIGQQTTRVGRLADAGC